MKYLKTKNSRRRGIAMELAIFVIMLCFGLSIIILTTSMIQKNNYNRIVNEHTLKLELERIGSEFCVAVRNEDLEYFQWKIGEETDYTIVVENIDSKRTLTIMDKDSSLLFVELTKIDDESYEITNWELK